MDDLGLAKAIAKLLDSNDRYQVFEMKTNEWLVMDHKSGAWQGVSKFVRNWNIAGQTMEKCGDLVIWNTGGEWVVEPPEIKDAARDESLPRAINLACVEALGDHK